MKIIILIITVMSLSGFAQDVPTQDTEATKKVPEIGRKVLPQEQEDDSSIPNPFLIGPYQDGKYTFPAPDEDAEEI